MAQANPSSSITNAAADIVTVFETITATSGASIATTATTASPASVTSATAPSPNGNGIGMVVGIWVGISLVMILLLVGGIFLGMKIAKRRREKRERIGQSAHVTSSDQPPPGEGQGVTPLQGPPGHYTEYYSGHASASAEPHEQMSEVTAIPHRPVDAFADKPNPRYG